MAPIKLTIWKSSQASFVFIYREGPWSCLPNWNTWIQEGLVSTEVHTPLVWKINKPDLIGFFFFLLVSMERLVSYIEKLMQHFHCTDQDEQTKHTASLFSLLCLSLGSQGNFCQQMIAKKTNLLLKLRLKICKNLLRKMRNWSFLPNINNQRAPSCEPSPVCCPAKHTGLNRCSPPPPLG